MVRCTGFYHSTPMIEFLHKGAHIANVTGEKISESQVVHAVRSVIDEMRLTLSHFTVSPVWGDPPRYQLLVERGDVGAPFGDSLAQQVDERLKLLNCEYKEKRATGRLAPMKWMPLPDGTWTAFSKSRRKNSGGSLEQYKHPCLVPDLEFGSKLFVEMAAIGSAAAADTSTSAHGHPAAPRASTRARPSGRLTNTRDILAIEIPRGLAGSEWGSGDFPAFFKPTRFRTATALRTAIP